MNSDERSWFKYRLAFALAHASILVSAVFVYVRHKKYCEPGSKYHIATSPVPLVSAILTSVVVYSIFAMMEWSIVAFNIAFHTTAIPEFRNMYITLGERENTKKE